MHGFEFGIRVVDFLCSGIWGFMAFGICMVSSSGILGFGVWDFVNFGFRDFGILELAWFVVETHAATPPLPARKNRSSHAN